MARPKTKTPTTFGDLPPELWNHIASYLPSARSIASLGRTNRSLHAFIEKDAWKEFTRQKFPTLCPPELSSHKDAARTLTTLSRAWDRRAFVATHVEPHGDITTFPGRKTTDKWKRPRGQTIGFTPQVDVFEDIEASWKDRRETFAFSAGAEICIRHTTRGSGKDDVRWTTYRPLSAREGRDDITTLHLVRPDHQIADERQHIVTGTANGDLQLLGIPIDDPYDQDVRSTYFTTQGMPVRSSSLLQDPFLPTLLATNLGDSRIALYQVDSEQSKIAASSQFDLKPVLRADGNPSVNHRAWSTNFLSRHLLAVGAGPSDEPIHIYPIAEDGLSRDGVRKLSLQNDLDTLDANITLAGFAKKSTSNIYTTVPLPAGNGSPGNGEVFLSGAYDGIIRLHDLRSNRDVEQAYVDPADDSAIYTILPRGGERMLVGTSRHNLLKVFDLRLGAKCYSYLDAAQQSKGSSDVVNPDNDYNIFLRASNPAFLARGSSWNRNRVLESSVYSLASSSAHSPYVYAGVENAIMSLAFTEMLDQQPDPTFFEPWSSERRHDIDPSRDVNKKEVLNLAMYDQDANMKLCVQRTPWEAKKASRSGSMYVREPRRLDERWRGADDALP
ncbi:Putative F-box domain, WD40/YVTN repeat-like-containing domain superfamily [Septoria linicola]|uniref:F-box domain, WD40/YVTN repeat-like-containing domain superfamily n=1 Tax=Septoria linicola TaxID=215465 RepID=A0A9Q9AN08_9PEZI|nr:putative F-box domain, WD40/YVTN repeat-like-containing domain superfamily [Septoria linicola]USW52294.1 Putative F-box domain, WD40/YVTN repeat-like-containing domain superfamily [Septoria linicola]